MHSLRAHIGLLGAVLAFAACTDQSYRGYETNYADFQTPLAVRIAVGDPYAVRGTGAKDKLNQMDGNHILVWAFNRADSTMSYTATRTATDSLHCLIDGKAAVLSANNSLAAWVDGLVWYPREELVGEKFDFYAAFVDDAKVLNTTRSQDKVQMELEIDGSQDIMTAKAKLPLRKNGEIKDYAFSYLSAMDGDSPIFTLDHRLVKIELFVRPGITYGFSNQMVISGATLETRCRGTLTVADRKAVAPNMEEMMFAANAPRANVELRAEDGTPFTPDTLNTINTYDEKTGTQRFVDDPVLLQMQRDSTHLLGSCFFVAPDSTYTLNLTMDPERRKPFPNTVRLLSGETFLPGHHYQVTMTVYGAYQLDIDVIMVPWVESGTIWVDRDADADREDNKTT